MPNWLNMLKLDSHIEGGAFGVFYKSEDKVSVKKDDVLVERSAGSSIYFFLEQHGYSAWHRLTYDEVWHFYDGGSPVDIHILSENEGFTTLTLGNPSITENASFQVVVKAGVWFAAEVRNKSSYALVGCTVSPGFEYEDFELAEKYRDALIAKHPGFSEQIDKFIHPNPGSVCEKLTDHECGDSRLFSADDYIEALDLKKHREGGFIVNNYQATQAVFTLSSTASCSSSERIEERAAGSSSYYLLNENEFSVWSQLKSDEIWHYYEGGSSVLIHKIDPSGNLSTQLLGNPAHFDGASFQVVIESGVWFAAELNNKSTFALIGRTFSPGFDRRDLVVAHTHSLINQFPAHAAVINRFLVDDESGNTFSRKAIGDATTALVSGSGVFSLFNQEDDKTIKGYITSVQESFGV